MKNRYIITRVECPLKNDIDAQFVCFPEDNECSGCRYGDTKEQLIKKVAQAIKKSLRDNFTKGYTEIAKEVIEFLGVEK